MFVTKVGFQNGCMNTESCTNKNDDKAYHIDVEARIGGNYTPLVINYASDFDFIETMLDFLKNFESAGETTVVGSCINSKVDEKSFE